MRERPFVVVVERGLMLVRGARGAPVLILAPAAPPSSPDASAPSRPHALRALPCPTACYPPLTLNDMPRYHSCVGLQLTSFNAPITNIFKNATINCIFCMNIVYQGFFTRQLLLKSIRTVGIHFKNLPKVQIH